MGALLDQQIADNEKLFVVEKGRDPKGRDGKIGTKGMKTQEGRRFRPVHYLLDKAPYLLYDALRCTGSVSAALRASTCGCMLPV